MKQTSQKTIPAQNAKVPGVDKGKPSVQSRKGSQNLNALLYC
jgi:hypothetical protein